MRTVTEVRVFTRDEIEKIIASAAKCEIIGGYYEGDFGVQTTKWARDGSLTVTTQHTPESK